MQVTSATQTTLTSQSTENASSGSTTGKLDYDAFLKLLVAELKNQDPTKPMDSAQYIGQLASFSNVEQSIKLNTKLDKLIAAQAASQAESLIGRTLTSPDGSISGKVNGLRIIDTGAIALLDNGKEIELGPGVVVSGS